MKQILKEDKPYCKEVKANGQKNREIIFMA